MSKAFWVLYLMFFIFVFPMFFEYVPLLFGGTSMFEYTSSWKSLLYLSIGTIGWIVFILVYYVKMVRVGKTAVRAANITLRDGVLRPSRIESKKILSEGSEHQISELELSFKNMSDVSVKMPYEIVDHSPHKNRFKVGERINIRINPAFGHPLIVVDGSILDKGKRFNYYTLGLYFLVIFCSCYLVFSYWLQNDGLGWRFLHLLHPWVAIPFYGLFFGLLIGGVLFQDVIGLHNKKAEQERKLLMKGKVAIATLRERKQTGLYINEQPQIRFEFEFTDNHGQIRIATLKKIISLLDLNTTNTREFPVFYNPEDPTQVMLAEDFYFPLD